MSSATRPAQPPLAAELVELVHAPTRTFPRLFEESHPAATMIFPAVSGIYFAYAAAQGLALSERIGFPAAAAGVVLVGSLLGLIALYFAGVLPAWSAMVPGERTREAERMMAVFSYATWPFLPLLVVIVPVDLWVHGTALFDRVRPEGTALAVWGVRGLEMAAIAAWLVLMVKGTAVARRERESEAARDLLRWTAEVVAIGVLFLLMFGVSLSFW